MLQQVLVAQDPPIDVHRGCRSGPTLGAYVDQDGHQPVGAWTAPAVQRRDAESAQRCPPADHGSGRLGRRHRLDPQVGIVRGQSVPRVDPAPEPLPERAVDLPAADAELAQRGGEQRAADGVIGQRGDRHPGHAAPPRGGGTSAGAGLWTTGAKPGPVDPQGP